MSSVKKYGATYGVKYSRKLTNGEIQLAQRLYRNSIDYYRIEIHDYPSPTQFGVPMQTPNDRDIYTYTRPSQSDTVFKQDYSLEPVGSISRYDFIHELAHIWQNQNGVLVQKIAVIFENIRTGFNYQNAYPYDLDASKDLLDYSMEQQAAILEDYFRILDGTVTRHIKPNNDVALFKKILGKFLKNPRYPMTEMPKRQEQNRGGDR